MIEKYKVATKTMLHGVMVSTQDFDSCNTGSNPVGVVRKRKFAFYDSYNIFLCGEQRFWVSVKATKHGTVVQW